VVVFLIIYFQERERGGGIRTLGSGSPRTLQSLVCLREIVISQSLYAYVPQSRDLLTLIRTQNRIHKRHSHRTIRKGNVGRNGYVPKLYYLDYLVCNTQICQNN